MPKKDEKQAPRVSVLERRLQNPFGEPAQTVRFKQQGLTARWFNDAARMSGGQIHRGHELGWQDVTADMITDMDSLGFYKLNPAGQITRGPRGEEVLMWMTTDDFHRIQEAKTAHNFREMRDYAGQKEAMTRAAADKYGDEFAEGVQKHVGIKDNYERIQVTPEQEG